MRSMFTQLTKSLVNVDHFMKVMVLWNYGMTLLMHEEFKHEGEDYIKQAD